MNANNEYKTVCDACGKKTWYEEIQQCHCTYPKRKICNTCGHSEEIEPLQMVRCKGILRKIDNSQLDNRLTHYYDNKKRVEITWKKGYEDYAGYGARTEGLKQRCYIGKSTGWKPIYLCILTSRSNGGGAILSEAIESIREI